MNSNASKIITAPYLYHKSVSRHVNTGHAPKILFSVHIVFLKIAVIKNPIIRQTKLKGSS